MFSSLRANDLIWPYVVNSYLKGQGLAGVRPAVLELRRDQPAGADVLLVRAQHVPREQPARAGQDRCSAAFRSTSRDVDVPAYHLRVARRPHRAVDDGVRVDASSSAATTTFVLGASGHIAGVINPPAKNKRNYWASGTEGSDPEHVAVPARSRFPGSWWPHWSEWLASHAGRRWLRARRSATSSIRSSSRRRDAT